MTARIRLIVLLGRPAVIALLAMFAVTGLAQGGRSGDPLGLAEVLVTVAGFLLFSVACNDLADEAIDRINLPGGGPLVTGAVTRPEFTIIGLTAGAVALAASATLGWWALLVTLVGLALSAGYSLRPVRIADRGAVASLLLPACYVAVPYLLGLLAARATIRPGDVVLLSGLYLGFIGRILLKDSAMSGGTRCSASGRSSSGTADAGPAASARAAGWPGRVSSWPPSASRLPSCWRPRRAAPSRPWGCCGRSPATQARAGTSSSSPRSRSSAAA
jgi:UbiA prenyltransferase family